VNHLNEQQLESLKEDLDFFQIPYEKPHSNEKSTVFHPLLLIGEYQKKIEEWLGGTKKIGSILYQATQDGFRASDFHRKCNNKGSTLTVIESSLGYIFGGYVDKEWISSSGFYVSSDNAFLFTLKNSFSIPPTKFDIKIPGTNAIVCNSSYGPIFGNGGNDLLIFDQSNSNSNSSSNFPTSYIDTTGKGNNLFAGSKTFTTKEIVVYQII